MPTKYSVPSSRPSLTRLLTTAWVIALKRHDLDNAQRNFERAVKLDSDYAEAMFNLGLVCMQTKDIPCARTAYRSFLVKAPAAYKTYIPQVKAQLAQLR